MPAKLTFLQPGRQRLLARLQARSLSAAALAAVLLASSCSNNPYQEDDPARPILYGTIEQDPKSLDPSFAYDGLSLSIIGPVYETLLQYHYLKRPYQLEPGLAEKMPEKVAEEDAEFVEGIEGAETAGTGPKKARRQPSPFGYRITLRKGIRFQDDPCWGPCSSSSRRGESRQSERHKDGLFGIL